MRKSGFLKVSLFSAVVLVISAAIPGVAQAPQVKKQQIRTQPEFDSYNACFTEKDFTKKADLCGKFVEDFKESDFVANGYKLIIQSYYQTMNWKLLMDAADKAAELPSADNELKDYAYESGMIAAQSANNLDKCVKYGDKVLTVAADNLNALYTVSTLLPQCSSSDIAELNRAAEMAHKALVIAASRMDKATTEEKPQLVQIDGGLHRTLGLIGYDEKEYQKSIQEYQLAIKDNVKDDASHFFMAYDYINLMVQESKDYQTALTAENDAKAAKADQPTVDDLAAKRAFFAEDILKYRDTVVDELAITVAINGPYTSQAKSELTKQWTTKNSSTAGLDDFISQKRAQLSQ